MDTPRIKTQKLHTSEFGVIDGTRVDEITLNLLDEQRDLISTKQGELAGEQWHVFEEEEWLLQFDKYRSDIGALRQQLWMDIEADIENAHALSGNWWHCMIETLIYRKLPPQKYREICGTPTHGYGAHVTFLANLPQQDTLTKRWGLSHGWRPTFVDAIWRSKNHLMELEKEYRDIAIANAQIGLGYGGMLIGFTGLALSILLTVLSLTLG